jgi:hypothetical protein
MLVLQSLISSHGVLDRLVRCEINGVCGPWTAVSSRKIPSPEICHKPAPTTTLETPLHNVRNPSTLDIVTIALDMPEYTAVGDGLTSCIRVYKRKVRNERGARQASSTGGRTFSKSMGYMTECSCEMSDAI